MAGFDPSGEWLRRPDVWSGLLLGGWAATKSFGPSLMPRGTLHQAIVTGASAASGFAIGNAAWGIVGDALEPGERQAGLVGAAAVGLAARLALSEQGAAGGEDLVRSTARSMADALAVGAAASFAAERLRRSRHPLPTAAMLGALAVGAGGVSVVKGLRAQLGKREELDPPPPRPLPALAQSATVAAVLAAIVNGYRHSGRASARVLRSRLGLSPDLSSMGGRVAATFAWGAVGFAFADTFVRGMELYNRVMDPGYDEPPTSTARSAGPGSLTTFSRTGRQGRRFILDVPDAAQIEAVMGEPSVAEPVRVFVGYDEARSAEERVAIALEELERCGAFERSLLVVASPAGTGVVNTVPFEAIDHLMLGDSAGVAVQYERLPSLLAMQRVPAGARHHRLLLEGIRDALALRPRSARPRVVTYGESLGAWAGQDAFLGAARTAARDPVAALDALGVDRALWVGTPYYSGWMRMARAALAAGTTPAGSILEVASAEELAREVSGCEGVPGGPRVVLLAHDDDPVNKLSLDLLVQRPRWLGSDRGPGIPSEQRYTPLVTAFQTIVDTANATNQTPGVFRATGHDYRSDLPRASALAFGLPDPGEEVSGRLVERLQSEEARRAALLRRPAHRQRPSARDSSVLDIEERPGSRRRRASSYSSS